MTETPEVKALIDDVQGMLLNLNNPKSSISILKTLDNIINKKPQTSNSISRIIYKSKKLGGLKPEMLKKLIRNMPHDFFALKSLCENYKLDDLVDFYPLIKSKLSEFGDSESNLLLELFDSNSSLKQNNTTDVNKKVGQTFSSIEQKLLNALDCGDVYKNLVEKTESDINKKHLKDNEKNSKEYEKKLKDYQEYLKIRNEKKELKQDLKDINALCNASEAGLAEVNAKLKPEYQRHTVTKFAIAITGKAIQSLLQDNDLTSTVKSFISKRIYKSNFQQAFDNMSVFSDETKPEPEQNFTQKPNIHEAIAKIETPLQKLNSILPELTLDNITSVSDETLARFFDTSAVMAVCDAFDIDDRLKPMVKLLEIIPDNKFKHNSVINNQRVFIVTDLIKNTIDLQRGDIATELMTHSIPKINNNNPELMRATSEISNSFRKELSDITALSVSLSKVDTRLKPVYKRKPLGKLLEFTKKNIIPEFTSYDPSEPMDIPVTGHLPEIIDSTIADLRQGETETLKSLIKHAHDNNPDLVVIGNDIFNGQDKKILSLILEKLRRSLNPNPLNEVMSDFLTLYTAGHFAEGGGFSDSTDDGQTQPLRVLERLTNAVKTQTRYNDEPTILERLDNKSVQTSELQGSPDNKSDFIKAYRQENGNLNRMKIRFNQHTPKPFKTSITDNMARHRRQTHIGNL